MVYLPLCFYGAHLEDDSMVLGVESEGTVLPGQLNLRSISIFLLNITAQKAAGIRSIGPSKTTHRGDSGLELVR